MARANPLWGAPRIHGELQKVGLEISQATVSKYLVRRRTPPSQTWRTFLANHIGSLVSVDFFTVPTVMFNVLFVFVVLAHDRRRVVHVNVTDAPTAQWTAQQLVEAFPWDTAPRYLLRDRDAVYGIVFSSRVQTLGILEVRRRRGLLGRIPMLNASSAPCAASALIIWSCSTRPTCVACCATTSSTTTAPEHTSPWTRTRQSPEGWSASIKAGSSRHPWSAGSITGTAGPHRPRPTGATGHTDVDGEGCPSRPRLPFPPADPVFGLTILATFCSGSVSFLSEKRCARPPTAPRPPGAAAMVKQKGQDRQSSVLLPSCGV